MTKHTKKWRISQFDDIKNLVSKYKVIAIGSLDGFPTALLQKLKKNLDDVVFKVTTRNVLKRVLEDKKDKDIIEVLPNQPIIILTNKNAFDLYQSIKKNKAKSKAKINMISPIDIIVPEGDTGLPPGPALSDLKKVGIKAKVRGSTIFVPEDTVILKKGEIINGDVVSTLSKLNIKPIELILDVVAAKEDGILYSLEALNVDAEDIFNRLLNAVRASINLGVDISYFTKLTVEPMIKKAYLEAKALENINKD